MKKNIVKYIFAMWFSMLLLLGNTPMEFVHLFASHKDTVHNTHDGLSIENKHHHCAFLSLTLTSFINDYRLPVLMFASDGYFTTHARISPNYIQRSIIAASLRGPPTA